MDYQSHIHLQDEITTRLFQDQREKQLWYVGLVLRSKMADVLRGDETDEELAAMLTPVKEPGINGWHWLLWEGCKLIGWRHPNNMSFSDDGAHIITFVEYMR